MKIKSLFILLCIATALFFSDTAFATNLKTIKKSVVRIIAANPADVENTGSSGTGFLVSSDGYIITNNHVVEMEDGSTPVIRAIFSRDRIYEARIIRLYPEKDLAVLRIDGSGFQPLILANGSSIAQMQVAIAIGFPGAADVSDDALYKHKTTQGTVSALITMNNGLRTIQVDTPINSGNSGGPLIDENGEVIGVNYIKHSGAESTGWAIHIDEVKKVLQELDISPASSSVISLSHAIKAGMFLLLCGGFFLLNRQKNKKADPKTEPDKPVNLADGLGSDRDQTNGSMTCIKGEFKGSRIDVSANGLIVGRDPAAAQLILSEKKISKQHARLTFRSESGDYLLEDMGSTNGTYAKGKKKRISSTILQPGDTFILGKDVAEFRVG